MRPEIAIYRARRAVHAAFAAVICLAILFAPVGVQAHVNRTVGPYTILLVLIEEPYFSTNHAGFAFWVHKGDTPVTGLDGTLHARAVGHDRTVDLRVSPRGTDQLYLVDQGLDGQPFDPLGGGAWSLRLTGMIDATPIDETFAVEFPAYPRAGTAVASASPTTAADVELLPPYLPLLLVGIGAFLALRALSRRRVGIAARAHVPDLDRQALDTPIGQGP